MDKVVELHLILYLINYYLQKIYFIISLTLRYKSIIRRDLNMDYLVVNGALLITVLVNVLTSLVQQIVHLIVNQIVLVILVAQD